MFEKYRSDKEYFAPSYEEGRRVTVKVVDFKTNLCYETKSITIYDYRPYRSSHYNIVFPLVNIYFNGVLLQAGIYYYYENHYIYDRAHLIVELAYW